MIGIGTLLAFLGFGSMAMNLLNVGITFRLLAWADPYQPWLGLVVGLLGLALIGAGIAANRKRAAAETGPTRHAGGAGNLDGGAHSH